MKLSVLAALLATSQAIQLVKSDVNKKKGIQPKAEKHKALEIDVSKKVLKKKA